LIPQAIPKKSGGAVPAVELRRDAQLRTDGKVNSWTAAASQNQKLRL
jgi:hypothetical protein